MPSRGLVAKYLLALCTVTSRPMGSRVKDSRFPRSTDTTRRCGATPTKLRQLPREGGSSKSHADGTGAIHRAIFPGPSCRRTGTQSTFPATSRCADRAEHPTTPATRTHLRRNSPPPSTAAGANTESCMNDFDDLAPCLAGTCPRLSSRSSTMTYRAAGYSDWQTRRGQERVDRSLHGWRCSGLAGRSVAATSNSGGNVPEAVHYPVFPDGSSSGS